MAILRWVPPILTAKALSLKNVISILAEALQHQKIRTNELTYKQTN